jgi:hypothetical protein
VNWDFSGIKQENAGKWYLPWEGTHAYRTYLHVTAMQGHSRRHQRTPQGGPPRPAARWGRPALTLGRPASSHAAMAPSFASYLYRLLWCISTLREGRFHTRATVDPPGLYKAASRPPGLIQSLQIITSNRIRNHRRRIEEPAIKKKTSSPSSLGIEFSLELELEERERRGGDLEGAPACRIFFNILYLWIQVLQDLASRSPW